MVGKHQTDSLISSTQLEKKSETGNKRENATLSELLDRLFQKRFVEICSLEKYSPPSLSCFTQSAVVRFPLSFGYYLWGRIMNCRKSMPKVYVPGLDTNSCCIWWCNTCMSSIVQLGEHSCNCLSVVNEAVVRGKNSWLHEAFSVSTSQILVLTSLMRGESQKELPLCSSAHPTWAQPEV